MISENVTNELSLEELRELIPQLQKITKKYKRSEQVQKSLFDISELASSINELSSLYPAIHEIISDFMPAKSFFVAFYEEENELIDFVYFVDEFDEQIIKKVSAEDLKHSLTGHLLRTGEHLFLTRENRQALLSNSTIKSMGADSVDWVGVPLKRGSQVIGAIVVQSYDEAERYSHEDLELLLFVSQHIVNCLDRVKSRELTERTIRQRTKQMRQINEELQEEISERQKVEALQQALFEISELSASVEGNMDDFYRTIHDILSRLIGAPNCYIALVDNENQILHFPYYKDEVYPQVKSRPIGLGVTEYIIRNGSAELIDPTRVKQLVENNELAVVTANSISKKMTSLIGVPLVVDGIILGVIAVQSYGNEKRYNLRDLEFLRYVSHHIAVALERKKYSDNIQAYNQRLTNEVKQRTEELHSTNVFLQKQIEERKQAQLQLEHDAHHDSLTGLANRALFNTRLDLALASKKRYSSHNFAVIFIDLDRFKQINDSLGHYAGDEFLKEVARRISSCIRGHDLLARLGGDEFVVLFDNFETATDIEEIASRIIKSIAQPFNIENKDVYSGASIGIASIESGYQKADEVLRDADAAMYQAKSLGRGRYIIFDKTMREQLLEELEIEGDFRKLLHADAFENYSQPVFNLQSKQAIYAECYIRWEHPTLGRIKREQYFQLAEQSGLTVEMDKFMLNKACNILRYWGLSNHDSAQKRKVAINLSTHHLTQTSLAKSLIEYINSCGIDPNKLVFEFDENALNRSSLFFLPAIKILKRAGITLVLDNFGSGLASLSYLYTYPFDYVKVDHLFVKSLTRSERNLKLLESLKAISAHLNFKLIAGGIDTEQQYQALINANCEFGQGKYLEASSQIDFSQNLDKAI
ncbi:EAL domain-containing protein [Paraglaciecola sp.]|uniref:bifunctional diguanylate cyclase/phosphodiesterase n=2 Tax=Paraglaciecola sp. TaxID=1920173 RepID=UPI003265B568